MAPKKADLFAQIAAQQQAAAVAAAANPVNYVPPSKRDETRNQVVLKIYVICHPPSTTKGSAKTGTNHWTLSFDIGNGQGIRLDIQPNYSQPHSSGGDKAQVVISKLPYVVSRSAVRQHPVSVKHRRTVGWYIDYFASQGRFRYAFTAEGVGCRKWTTDALKLLADAGEASATESETARHALAYTWPSQRPAEPAAGTYF